MFHLDPAQILQRLERPKKADAERGQDLYHLIYFADTGFLLLFSWAYFARGFHCSVYFIMSSSVF